MKDRKVYPAEHFANSVVVEYQDNDVLFSVVKRNDGTASVLNLFGGSIDSKCALVQRFFQEFPEVWKLTNQVHNVSELKACYKAGLRYHSQESNCPFNLSETVALVKAHEVPSVKMIWKRS